MTTPLTTNEALEFCKCSDDQFDLFENTLIPAAFEMVEQAIGRKLTKGRVVEYFDGWPESGEIRLCYGSICKIESIEQSDGNGCFTELKIRDFEWRLQTGKVRIPCGCCPAIDCGCPPRYRITYIAGPEACQLPARAKLLMMQLVCTANMNRGSDTEANLKQSPIFERLIKSLKKPRMYG